MNDFDIAGILEDPETKVIVCCGSGGVGKTTMAASLAVRAAEQGRKVAVLTIDPARRLAQALGVEELGNSPKALTLGPDAKGTLDAMMLDMKRTFDDMIIGHATPEKAEQILANPFYQSMATSFSGTQEYMAMEKLGQLIAEEKWDLIVVDTPPSRNALDFLDAPQRAAKLTDGRMLRVLSASGRGAGRLVSATVRLGLKAVSSIIGGQMLSEVAVIVEAFDSIWGGFGQRALETYELLGRPGTYFLVVAAPEPDPLREASFFVDRLATDGMPLAGLIVNRTHPSWCDIAPKRATAAADAIETTGAGDDGALATGALRIHARRVEAAEREQLLVERFASEHPSVPWKPVAAMSSEVVDIDALRAIADQLTTV
ncbi:ArsA family ATPase [Smaragdicoccus niigatensis]|uniref:ArsA family ATPase n=1 Tax=Smaragdicoccus niigatensis TaxID=359359 RepID=UPI00037C2C11|nr:ArsA family ATPase [Smaragdicoccus niigatensis]